MGRPERFMQPIIFYSAAAITVIAVLLMIFQANPVASAIYLVLSFFSLAVLYVLLQAPFVAALQILVYAGAIMVLFIFVIMLLNLKNDEISYEKICAKSVGIVLLGTGLFGFLAHYLFKIPAVGFIVPPVNFGNVNGIAELMLNDYVVPFEVMGILLLVGLVGAIVLGRREE